MPRHLVMFVEPLDLALAAHCADIPAPIDELTYVPGKYPRFDTFVRFQLYVPMYPGIHYRNAKIIGRIPENQLHSVTLMDLLLMGWSQCLP